ncbi:hypothetical protein Micbo1qcDRAFT_27341 [Microdochium bolleyi]|uniref:G-patch domain-containing protein n=1 Tax=Microdochium bolleyi TaxID=196109 RepID=A0A136JEJ5_9PEZI|nr:hypothetical protein Micbo1qcDRAFT_27341 [Microdochium bolleyi]
MADAADEEDDYMNMTFDDTTTAATAQKAESSLQRRQRLKREGEMRGRVKSKAELAAEAAAEREAALSRSLIENDRTALRKSKGLAMMAKMGYKPGSALGRRKEEEEEEGGRKKTEEAGKDVGAGTGTNSASGTPAADGAGGQKSREASFSTARPAGDTPRTEPIRLEMKEDRGGIGLDSEKKRKINEAYAEQDKRAKTMDEGEFRDRVRRERELARAERQCHAAMKVCEKLYEDGVRQGEADNAVAAGRSNEMDGGVGRDSTTPPTGGEAKRRTAPLSSRPLKSIPVEWRGLVRSREETERDRRIRYDLEQTSRLPTYDDDTEDADDRTALGKSAAAAYVHVEDLEEDDLELEEFASLEADEKLRRLVVYLRKEHNYCFWCKYQYDDDTLDGCPGLTEEEHD